MSSPLHTLTKFTAKRAIKDAQKAVKPTQVEVDVPEEPMPTDAASLADIIIKKMSLQSKKR